MREFVLAALAAMGLAASAEAATLDFNTDGHIGYLSGNAFAAVDGVATARVTEGGFLNLGPVFCALNTDKTACTGNMDLQFAAPVYNVVLNSGVFEIGDRVTVSVFGLTRFASYVLQGAGDIISLDLASLGGISRIFFDDGSTANGVTWGPVSYTLTPDVAPVPLPASLPLLAGALAALSLRRRRRRRA